VKDIMQSLQIFHQFFISFPYFCGIIQLAGFRSQVYLSGREGGEWSEAYEKACFQRPQATFFPPNRATVFSSYKTLEAIWLWRAGNGLLAFPLVGNGGHFCPGLVAKIDYLICDRSLADDQMIYDDRHGHWTLQRVESVTNVMLLAVK